MALGTGASVSSIKRFAKNDNTIYLKETDSAFTPLTTGDGTVWTLLGTMKGTTLAPMIDEFRDKGDGGKVTVLDPLIEAYKITTTAMQRDKPTRQMHLNTYGKFYQIAAQGQTLGTQTEVHVLCGVVKQGFSYAMGGEGQFTGIEIETLNNVATISVTLPTAIATATISIPASQMSATDNV